METKNRGGNASFGERLKRALKHGSNQLNLTGERKEFSKIGVTYYLLYDKRIVTYREWNWMNKPEYIVKGSYFGCIQHNERLAHA